MITREVSEWLDKVKRKQYSYEDAMSEFAYFSSFLTREEIEEFADILRQTISEVSLRGID